MVNPIHVSGTDENNVVVAVNIRAYYPIGMSDQEIRDDLNDWLGESSRLVSAYLMVSDGFGHLQPEDEPIA